MHYRQIHTVEIELFRFSVLNLVLLMMALRCRSAREAAHESPYHYRRALFASAILMSTLYLLGLYCCTSSTLYGITEIQEKQIVGMHEPTSLFASAFGQLYSCEGATKEQCIDGDWMLTGLCE